MPKAGNESLDFFWLNKTWSVEEHSAFQTQKINPSKLSNLKTRIKSIQLLAQLVLQPFGGSLTWFFQTLLRKKWRRVDQNNYQHLRVKIDIQNEKSLCMLGTFVFLISVKETNHWIFVVSKITSQKFLSRIQCQYLESTPEIQDSNGTWRFSLGFPASRIILGPRPWAPYTWKYHWFPCALADFPSLCWVNDPIWSRFFGMGGSTTNWSKSNHPSKKSEMNPTVDAFRNSIVLDMI